ncbi:hypothetical protein L6R50_15185 [Myxococcota bacterium]|nr:hypothetical protein [Myxococcota bacterium]
MALAPSSAGLVVAFVAALAASASAYAQGRGWGHCPGCPGGWGMGGWGLLAWILGLLFALVLALLLVAMLVFIIRFLRGGGGGETKA